MRMTGAELDLLARHARLGRPQRRRDRRGPRRAHLRLRRVRAVPARLRRRARACGFDDLKRGWAGAHAAHLQAIFGEAAKPNGFGVAYFEGLLRRRHPAQQDQPAAEVVPGHVSRAARHRPRRAARRRAGAGAGRQALVERRSESRRRRGAARRRARALADLQLRLAGDRRGVLLRHVRVDRRRPALDRRGRPGPRHLRPARRRPRQAAGHAADLRRPRPSSSRTCARRCTSGSARPARRSPSWPRAPRASPTGAARQADVAVQSRAAVEQATTRRRRRERAQPHRHRRRDGRHRRAQRRPHPDRGRRDRDHRARRPLASRSAASSRRSRTSRARRTCSRSTPRSRPPAPASAAAASPSSPTRCASSPSAPPSRPPTPAS